VTWANIARAREASNTAGPWRHMLVNLDHYDRAIADPDDDRRTLLFGLHPTMALAVDSPLDEIVTAMGLKP